MLACNCHETIPCLNGAMRLQGDYSALLLDKIQTRVITTNSHSCMHPKFKFPLQTGHNRFRTLCQQSRDRKFTGDRMPDPPLCHKQALTCLGDFPIQQRRETLPAPEDALTANGAVSAGNLG